METNQVVEDICNQFESNQYAMYLRKSRADLEMEALGEGETLARHKARLDTLAAKHNIHPDQITVYREVVSGESIQDRPEMQKLLSEVYKKKYKGVLVVEVERLARGNTKDQGEVADAFQYGNTLIITPSKVYDPHNEFDQEYFEFGLFMSRREYKTITRRMVSGKDQSAAEGNYVSNVRPYGFNIVRTSKKDRYLVPIPEEVKIVQMIFDWWTEDKKSIGWIARELTTMGIPTVKKKPEWNRETVRGLLANVHYLGLVRWGQKKTVKELDPKTGKMVKVRRAAEPQISNGKHDAIITQEQFDKAQARFQKQPPLQVSKPLMNPYAGLLRCCDCGKNLTWHDFKDGVRAIRYVHPRSMVCHKKSVRADVLDNAVIEALQAHIVDCEIKMENEDQTELIRHREKIAVLEAELSKQEKKRRRLFDSWEEDDGMYTKEEFLERKQLYAHTIEKLKEQIQIAKENTPAPIDFEERISTIHKLIACIKNPTLSAKDKNDFLKEFISIIKYDFIDLGHKKGVKPILDIQFK